MTYANLAVWCAQIALLAAAGAIIAALVRLRPAPARLHYWQALLAICLALPLFQPWQRRTVVATPAAELTAAPVVSVPAAPVSPRPVPWERIGLAVLAAGVLLRLGHFGLGLVRLSHYRRNAQPFGSLPEPVEQVMRDLCCYPEMALSTEISGPVTFGFVNPVILFPARLLEMDPAHQAAVACHELLHVRRRDWLFMVAEEMVRALFWFHPAVWWMLARIQLAREQSVDREVIRRSVAREHYVEALLSVSGARSQLDLAPAPLFLRRRHLTARVAALLKEAGMSPRRLLLSLAACAGVLSVAGWLVCTALPLYAAPQIIADAPGVKVTGADRIIHRNPIPYPAEAHAKGIEGTVILDVVLAPDGTVSDAAVISGPEELRKAALAPVLTWHFMRDSAPRLQVTVEFKLGETRTPPPPPPPPPPPATFSLKRIVIHGLSPEATETLRSRLPVREGQVADQQTLEKVRQIARGFDPELTCILSTFSSSTDGASSSGTLLTIRKGPGFMGRSIDSDMPRKIMGAEIRGLSAEAAGELRRRLAIREGVTLDRSGFMEESGRVDRIVKEFDPHLKVMNMSRMQTSDAAEITFVITPEGYAAPPSFPPAEPGVMRIRVGSAVQAHKLKSNPQPVYPPLAQQARIQGIVKLNVVIDREGRMKNIQVASGHPLLVPAAMEAVKRYEYDTTLLNGQSVEVVTEVEVPFTLK